VKISDDQTAAYYDIEVTNIDRPQVIYVAYTPGQRDDAISVVFGSWGDDPLRGLDRTRAAAEVSVTEIPTLRVSTPGMHPARRTKLREQTRLTAEQRKAMRGSSSTPASMLPVAAAQVAAVKLAMEVHLGQTNEQLLSQKRIIGIGSELGARTLAAASSFMKFDDMIFHNPVNPYPIEGTTSLASFITKVVPHLNDGKQRYLQENKQAGILVSDDMPDRFFQDPISLFGHFVRLMATDTLLGDLQQGYGKGIDHDTRFAIIHGTDVVSSPDANSALATELERAGLLVVQVERQGATHPQSVSVLRMGFVLRHALQQLDRL
jgi:hypothetical protein